AYWPCEEDPDTSIIGAGIDGGTTMSVSVGTPKWKAISDFNGSAPIGVINKSTWDGLTGSLNTSGNDVYSAPGNYQWIAPAATASVTCIGPGGPGGNGLIVNGAGGGGGGGEQANEPTLALTVGQAYSFTVQRGDGTGTSQTFTGDAVTVTAHA